MLLEDIKTILGIEDNALDDKLNIYIKRAVYTIKIYLNNEDLTDEKIKENFEEAIIALVTNAQTEDASGNKGIKSKSQGARSVTYADDKGFTISNDVRALLPPPYLRMR